MSDSGTRPELWMAPMRGITTPEFRAVWRKHSGGLRGAVTPFIALSRTSRLRPERVRRHLGDPAPGWRVIPQALTSDSEPFLELAHIVADLGCDELNLNLGCPWKKIRKKGRGCGLLAHPDRLFSFLDTVCPRLPVSLSIKVRPGIERLDELDALVPRLNAYPLAHVTIHPRTAEQMYTGCADLETFRRLAQAFTAPVWYNGDLLSVRDFRRFRAALPRQRTWMLGRGLLIHPFLAEMIVGDRTVLPDYLPKLRAFHEDLLRVYCDELPPRSVTGRMKELWSYLAQGLPHGDAAFDRIKHARSPEELREAAARVLDEASR
ncbi:tRNA dihydrouridine synthase [Kiritimatiella glycovorans]|uniref:tRNA-dihydrouridine synthase n=1 Tax=Kiritimatiella glycovorans TaxID=1307763 RepID=A0A0G3EBR4_9BACT|nr:tRNA-dihydrouridine synthase family protein [Kiritimatiella glycovorans]AKJ63748.1 putative tRNA-dihydrouridine synthase [Kiritimatiella glycovorans]